MKKKWVYLMSLIGVIAVLVIVDLYSRKQMLEKQLQNQYAQQLALASEEMTQLHQALFQSTILNDEQALNEQLLQIYESSGNIKNSLSAIPVLSYEANDWLHYMTRMQNLAANTIHQASYKEWHEKSPQLAEDFGVLEEEWAVLNANFFNHTSTLNDYNTEKPPVTKLASNLKTYTENSFPVTASESDYEKKKKLEQVSFPPISKKEAEKKLFKLLPSLKGATLTVSLNEKDAPYEFYHIQFVRGSRIGYVDILKNGGLVLSMLIDRPIQEQQISQQEARQHVEEFLQQQKMADAQFVEVRENHEAWHFVYARSVNGVLIYPDALQIKVAKDMPEIIGMSALEYVQQEQVDIKNYPEIDWERYINSNAKVQQSRLVVIEGKDYDPIVCYEALITSNKDGNHTYRMYVNVESKSIEKIELLN